MIDVRPAIRKSVVNNKINQRKQFNVVNSFISLVLILTIIIMPYNGYTASLSKKSVLPSREESQKATVNDKLNPSKLVVLPTEKEIQNIDDNSEVDSNSVVIKDQSIKKIVKIDSPVTIDPAPKKVKEDSKEMGDKNQEEANDNEGCSGTGSSVNTVIMHPIKIETIKVVDDNYLASKNIILNVDASHGLLQNDKNALIVKLVNEDFKGILKLKEDGSFTYQPDKNFVGKISFKYQASNKEESATGEVVITVVNDLPLANADEYKVEVNKTVKENVLKNDSDLNGDKLSAVYTKPLGPKPVPVDDLIVVDAREMFPIKLHYGILKSFNADGTFIYEAGNKEGVDTFVYKNYDGSDYSANTEVTIMISALANNKPVANAGVDQTVSEGSLVTLDASASNDLDAEDTLTYLWTAPGGITLSSSTAIKPTFTAPEVSMDTSYIFTLTVSDGKSSDSDTVAITVDNISSGGSGGGVHVLTCSPSVVSNGNVASYPSCAITCNTGYYLNNNQCLLSRSDNSEEGVNEDTGSSEEDTKGVINEEGAVGDGRVLGEKVWSDQLLRCDDHKVFAIRNNVRIYVPDLKTLREEYFGQDINYATCEDIANIPGVLGDNTKKQCVADRKFKNGELIRGSNMRIFVIVDGHKVYISSLEELLHKHFGKEIYNVCDSVLELY